MLLELKNETLYCEYASNIQKIFNLKTHICFIVSIRIHIIILDH